MSQTTSRRLEPLDTLRGLIMVLMALDHASFFLARVHPFEFWSGPLPDYGSSASWFFTRWVTHFCAPGFFFLMGSGMALFSASRLEAGWSHQRISRHFLLRGLLLIPVFYLLEAPVWMAAMGGPRGGKMSFIVLTVLITLGLSMILAAPLLRLSTRSWLAMAFIAIMAPDFLIPTLMKHGGHVGLIMRIFVVPGETFPISTMYPILPWFGICALGIGFGQLVERSRDLALRAMLPMGLAYLLAFAGVRIGGGFGNLREAAGAGWIPFLTVVKYPPSLAFSLLTLGGNLTLLSLFHRAGPWLDAFKRLLSVFGQAPLFFYLAHLYVFLILRFALFPRDAAPQWALYPAWLAGVALLYPACKWYRSFKSAKPDGSLWRMF
ncbi:MAG: DUF1624 domain-containing protein [Candidatus Solibacter usitatus]|nr:DUF1624 domain-containing protein [Candidatus Solibacter usitatus]